MSIITAMASDTEYGQMDDEELTQLQEAYRKLGQPVPGSLEDELELRTLAKELREAIAAQENTKVPGSAAAADDPGPPPVQEAIENRTGNSIDRRRMIYLRVGLFLLVATILFPPWSFKYPRISYGFLFRPPVGAATINLTLLFVEWVLVAVVISGLLLARGKRLLALQSDPEQLKNSLQTRRGKKWPRKFLIPILTIAAICAIGLGYYCFRRIARSLPPTEVSKLAGGAYITNYGRFEWNAYNGSDFVLTEVRVSISVFDEKGNAFISNRVYRVPASDFYPQQTKQLSTDVGFSLGQDQKWGWFVVGAKGRPE